MSFLVPLFSSIIIAAVITSAIVSVIQAFQPPKPSKISFGSTGDVGGSPRYGNIGPLDNTVSNELAVPVLYGQLKLAGNVIWQTAPGSTVNRIVGLCEGQINSVTDVRLNDIVVNAANTPGSSYTAYLGTSLQNADPGVPTNLRADLALHNLAYLFMTIAVSDNVKGGNPTVTCVAQGTLVETWDGTQWLTAKSYSRNPAACVRDFLLNARYGLGIAKANLNDATFGEVYDYCEGLVDSSSGKEARFRLDYIADTQRPAQDVLNDMLATFGGFLVYSGNKVKLHIEKQESITQFFGDGSTTKANAEWDPGNIVKDSFGWNMSSVDDRPNRIRLQWIDTSQNYVKVYTQVEDRIDQDDRGTIITKDVAMLGITRQTQASRMAKLLMMNAKYVNLNLSFSARLESIHCEVGDVIAVTHQSAKFTRRLFRISQMQEAEDETIRFTCREYNGAIFNDGQAAAILTYTQPSGPNLYAALSDVTELTLREDNYKNKDGVFVTNILASWTAILADQLLRLDRYLIQLSSDGGATYRDVAFAASNQTSYRIVLGNVQTGTTFTVRIKTISDRGAVSAGATAQITIQGKQTPPSNVSDFDVSFAYDHIAMTWSSVNDSDLFGYEIRVGDSSSTWETAIIVTTETLGTRFDLFNFTTGAKKFFIKAIDNSSNYSEKAVSDSITITSIPERNVVATFDLWSRISVLPHPLQGNLSSNLERVATNNYNPAYNRITLQPKTSKLWSDYQSDYSSWLAFQNSGFTWGRESYVITEQNYNLDDDNSTPPTSSPTCFASDTVLILHMNGSAGGTSFPDASANNFSFTVNGNAQTDTANKKFGTASLLCDGNDDYISTPDNNAFAFGSGDFTIDFWYRPAVVNVTQYMLGQANNGCGDISFYFQMSNANIKFIIFKNDGSTSVTITSSTAMAVGNWYHVAAIRNGNTITLYQDGVSVGTADVTGWTTYDSGSSFYVGTLSAGCGNTSALNGNLDELRIVKGKAIWTAAFSPPGEAYVGCASPITGRAIDLGSSITGSFNLDLIGYSSSNLGFISPYISTSSDNIKFTAYKPFSPGQYTARYIKFKFLIQATNSATVVRLAGAYLTIDVPDKYQSILNQAIGAGGSTIFPDGFTKVKSIVATTVGTSALTPRIDDQSNLPTSFLLKLFDTAGNLQAGNVNIYIQGY